MDSSRPATPSTPDEQPIPNGTNGVNGDHTEENAAPRPPPHRTPTDTPKKSEAELKQEAEAAKEEGNKFFKAKQYEKAIAEYTKGRKQSMTTVRRKSRLISLKLSRPTHRLRHIDQIVQQLTCLRPSLSMH